MENCDPEIFIGYQEENDLGSESENSLDRNLPQKENQDFAQSWPLSTNPKFISTDSFSSKKNDEAIQWPNNTLNNLLVQLTVLLIIIGIFSFVISESNEIKIIIFCIFLTIIIYAIIRRCFRYIEHRRFENEMREELLAISKDFF